MFVFQLLAFRDFGCPTTWPRCTRQAEHEEEQAEQWMAAACAGRLRLAASGARPRGPASVPGKAQWLCDVLLCSCGGLCLQLDKALPTLQAVRNKALMQYATPFSALDLNAMAAFFNTTAG